MISSTIGKAFHKALRKDLAEEFEQRALPLQLGGRPHKAVQQASQAMVAFTAWKRAEKQSHAVVFVDIKAAYYTLCRQIVTCTSDLDTAAIHLFDALGLPKTSFQDFVQWLTAEGELSLQNGDIYASHLTDELLNSTWYGLKHDRRPSVTRKGSRPGDNVADLIFSYGFKQMLTKVIDTLRQQQLIEVISWTGRRDVLPVLPDSKAQAVEILGPIWADDLAMLFSDEKPARLLRKIRTATSLVHYHLKQTGMDINFAAGKTEAVIQLYGSEAKIHKQELLRHGQPCITLSQDGPCLRIVPHYMCTWERYIGGREPCFPK